MLSVGSQHWSILVCRSRLLSVSIIKTHQQGANVMVPLVGRTTLRATVWVRAILTNEEMGVLAVVKNEKLQLQKKKKKKKKKHCPTHLFSARLGKFYDFLLTQRMDHRAFL